MSEILRVKTQNKILTLCINRPDKLNALTPKLLKSIRSELDAAAKNKAVSVVVIKSEGRVFCAGYDLNAENWITSQYPADHEDGVAREQDEHDIKALLDYWLDIWRFPKPIIVQVQGACLSGAGELLAVSDLVVASENASFGHPAARDLGIPPTVFFWPLTIGMRKSKELLFTARSMDAKEALASGLVNKVVCPDLLESETRSLAEDIAKTPVEHLIILKSSVNNFYDTQDLAQATHQAALLDAEFHQSPTFLAFFKLVREKGMKAALAERKRLFG